MPCHAFELSNVSSAAEGELTVSRQSVLILLAFAAIACIALGSVAYNDLSVLGVFFGLFVLLALSAAVLRPRSGRAERVELELEPPGWVAHVDLLAGPARASFRSFRDACTKGILVISARNIQSGHYGKFSCGLCASVADGNRSAWTLCTMP